MKVSNLLLFLLFAQVAMGQKADPTPALQSVPSSRYRTASAVVFGFGLATGLPMLLSKDQNMNEIGKAWTGFTSIAAGTLFTVAFTIDNRNSKHPYRSKRRSP